MGMIDGYTSTPPLPNNAAPGNSPGQVRLRTDKNGNGQIWKEVLLYVPSSLQGSLTIGAPYYADFSGTEAQNPQMAALAGNATSGITRQLVVLMGDLVETGSTPATGTFAWCAFWGTVSVLVDGTTDVAKGDFLKVNSKVKSGALIQDATTQSSLSVGIAQAAQTADSAVLTQVYLLGDRSTLA